MEGFLHFVVVVVVVVVADVSCSCSCGCCCSCCLEPQGSEVVCRISLFFSIVDSLCCCMPLLLVFICVLCPNFSVGAQSSFCTSRRSLRRPYEGIKTVE